MGERSHSSVTSPWRPCPCAPAWRCALRSNTTRGASCAPRVRWRGSAAVSGSMPHARSRESGVGGLAEAMPDAVVEWAVVGCALRSRTARGASSVRRMRFRRSTAAEESMPFACLHACGVGPHVQCGGQTVSLECDCLCGGCPVGSWNVRNGTKSAAACGDRSCGSVACLCTCLRRLITVSLYADCLLSGSNSNS